MDARKAIREVIESIGAEGQTETIVYTQAQVADIIASILPDALKPNGHVVIALPEVEPYESGRRYVRVPITAQPWSDGAVRISPHGDQVAIRNVPDKLPVQDAPALASALMAAHTVWSRDTRKRRYRRPDLHVWQNKSQHVGGTTISTA